VAVFVLIAGVGGHAAYWNRLIPQLETRGHRAWGNTGSGSARRDADLADGRDPTSIGISCTTFPTTRGRNCYPLRRASRLPRRWRSPVSSPLAGSSHEGAD